MEGVLTGDYDSREWLELFRQWLLVQFEIVEARLIGHNPGGVFGRLREIAADITAVEDDSIVHSTCGR